MKILQAQITDLKDIMPWISNEQACKMWAGPSVRFPLIIDRLLKDIDFSDENSYCYKNDGTILSFGQLLKKGNEWLHLARIIVAPIRRGNGYGQLLCAELIQIAAQQDCQKISLNVYKNNTGAIKLYTRLGFIKIPEKSAAGTHHMIKT